MPTPVMSAAFPDAPGVYVVYGDDERPLYVGVAASQTIAERWHRQHLRPRAGSSALRRTLGVHLHLVATKLRTKDGRYYPPEVEAAITAFLSGLTVDFFTTADADSAKALERRLIHRLEPTLNVRRPSVETRARAALAAGLKALRPDASFDHRGYVELEQNLIGVGRADIEREFSAGAGRELESKMRAPWSSSALAVNSFGRWRQQLGAFTLAGLADLEPPLAFEAKCDHGVRGTWPHLDVIVRHRGGVVGVESKCLEPTRAHPTPTVSDAYWALAERGDPRSRSAFFAVLDRVAEFVHLDVYQLVKHYLGLAHSYPEPRTLVYIYWEPANEEPLFVRHHAEVERFQALVGGDPSCDFVALSYAEHWHALRGQSPAPLWLPTHLDALELRYAVTI
jgi:hypothetical protein